MLYSYTILIQREHKGMEGAIRSDPILHELQTLNPQLHELETRV